MKALERVVIQLISEMEFLVLHIASRTPCTLCSSWRSRTIRNCCPQSSHCWWRHFFCFAFSLTVVRELEWLPCIFFFFSVSTWCDFSFILDCSKALEFGGELIICLWLGQLKVPHCHDWHCFCLKMVEHLRNYFKILSFGCKYQFMDIYSEKKNVARDCSHGHFFLLWALNPLPLWDLSPLWWGCWPCPRSCSGTGSSEVTSCGNRKLILSWPGGKHHLPPLLSLATLAPSVWLRLVCLS